MLKLINIGLRGTRLCLRHVDNYLQGLAPYSGGRIIMDLKATSKDQLTNSEPPT